MCLEEKMEGKCKSYDPPIHYIAEISITVYRLKLCLHTFFLCNEVLF